ncbi:MAG: glycoside hydrolase family 2 protein [Ruminococcaceae bacterium]|nr:glycoside hydrolase family 2 protein [Oscillospiraceae bacterium]MBE7004991.1 glycoside hydrolase family 2 protein [Oscillospiraceae bacterium]
MRNITNIDGGWRFLKAAIPVQTAMAYAAQGERITLPHTWNAIDGQDGGNDYHRGCCWYVRELTAEETAGERLFLEVNGANHTAEVYLNGKKLTRHEGGYSTFRVDLTEELAETNTLAISVDNSDSDRVYPQKADFTFYGGLYRDVNLISVPAEHFELLKDGTTGIKVTPIVDLENRRATVTVETWHNAASVDITVNGETKTVERTAEFVIENVRLWDGLDDPFLYTATAKLPSGDEVSTRFGCRVFAFDPEKGFFLNGRSYPLRGVSRHQDRKGKGNALAYADHKADMAIIRELGANTLRLAHYQHAQEFYDLCDENGLVVWAEIPYITMHMQNGRQNTLDQMRELITQCCNHPCIAAWGLSNEITAASAVSEELLENHRALNDLCHRIDPTRPTTMANVFMLEIESPILEIPDINSYNLYFGWYLGELTQTDEFFDEYHAKYPDRVIGFSEYGADANPAFHSSHPEKGDYTEEYQALYHEHMLQMIEARPYLWATHVWNLFDFAADGRDEGGKHGENQKGLVTFDRNLRKDAFYLYKAAWNKAQHFVHLCGKRYENRAEAETEIKVYSNCGEVKLYVDGTLVGEQTGKTVFRFRIPLLGEHLIRAEGDECSDQMVIRRVDAPDESYIFNKAAASVANWFDADALDPTCFSVQDKLGELRQHPQAGAVVEAMMAKSSAERGDVADAVKDNPALQRMLGRMTMLSLLKQAGADEESIKQLNRVLQGIRK